MKVISITIRPLQDRDGDGVAEQHLFYPLVTNCSAHEVLISNEDKKMKKTATFLFV